MDLLQRCMAPNLPEAHSSLPPSPDPASAFDRTSVGQDEPARKWRRHPIDARGLRIVRSSTGEIEVRSVEAFEGRVLDPRADADRAARSEILAEVLRFESHGIESAILLHATDGAGILVDGSVPSGVAELADHCEIAFDGERFYFSERRAAAIETYRRDAPEPSEDFEPDKAAQPGATVSSGHPAGIEATVDRCARCDLAFANGDTIQRCGRCHTAHHEGPTAAPDAPATLYCGQSYDPICARCSESWDANDWTPAS